MENSTLPTDAIEDISECVVRYESVLRDLLDTHAPMKERLITLRPHAPWYCDELREAKQRKRRLERKMRKSGLEIDKQMFSDQCQRYRQMLNQAKCSYHRNEIAQCDDRKLFALVDRMCKPKQARVLPDHESEKRLADDFATFFHSKVRDLRDKLDNITPPDISVDIVDTCDSTFSSFATLEMEDVKKLISQSSNASCSLDPIPTSLLKSCVEPCLPLITNIINLSLSSGQIPQTLKTAQVVPLLKKQGMDHNEFKNYRPISNLKFLFKTIERAAAKQVNDYLQSNGLHAPQQSAYRRFHSTETALVRIQNDLLEAVDKHHEAVLVLLDFSAAFDTIDHHTILQRLQARYGIVGTPLKWFESYLRGRAQTVDIGGVLSDSLTLEEGVPQGSVFGPSIFTMYTAPLGDVITSHGISYMTYADDTQLYLILNKDDRRDSVTRLELCIRDVKSWSIRNTLMFNDSKTEVIHVSSKFLTSPSLPKISIGDSAIDFANSAKSLGVTLDKSLDMKKHVKNIVSAASFAIYRIGQLRKYLDRQSTERLIHAFVSSRIDCCNSLLYGLPSTEISKLQRVQNSAARLVSLSKKRDHVTPILQELHWLPVQYRIDYKIALLTFKALNGMAPSYLGELLTRYIPSCKLRSSSGLLLRHPKKRKTMYYGDRSFSAAAPKIWNNLPADIRSLTSLDPFKKALKTFIFKKAYT